MRNDHITRTDWYLTLALCLWFAAPLVLPPSRWGPQASGAWIVGLLLLFLIAVCRGLNLWPVKADPPDSVKADPSDAVERTLFDHLKPARLMITWWIVSGTATVAVGFPRVQVSLRHYRNQSPTKPDPDDDGGVGIKGDLDLTLTKISPKPNEVVSPHLAAVSVHFHCPQELDSQRCRITVQPLDPDRQIMTISDNGLTAQLQGLPLAPDAYMVIVDLYDLAGHSGEITYHFLVPFLQDFTGGDLGYWQTDGRVQEGRLLMCSPQKIDEAALRRRFAGDIVVEMEVETVAPYVGGFGLVVSGSYAIVFEPDGVTVRIKKGLKELSKTSLEEPLQPSVPYHLKVQRQGDTLHAFVDGVLVAQATDPAPLGPSHNRVAVQVLRSHLFVDNVSIYPPLPSH
jgi:hypothetical protein